MQPVIQCENVNRQYGTFKAVRDLNLKVLAGEIYGFLGLNGAGKTTTIRMLLGLIAPDGGTIQVLGKEISRGSGGPWDRVGSIVETPASYPDLSVRENLEIIRRMRGLDRERVDSIMEALGIHQYENRKAGHLSLGNYQRLGLARALIHSPELLILDEPSNGLDPAGIVEIRELLLDLAKNHGTTIFLSSHILGEVSKIAGKIGIIHRGQLVRELTTAELHGERIRKLWIRTNQPDSTISLFKSRGIQTSGIIQGGWLECIENNWLQNTEALVTLLCQADLPPAELKIEEESLEDFFLRSIEGEVEKQ